MRLIGRLVQLVALCVVAGSVVAKEQTVSLQLRSIQVIQASEKAGDELYFKIMAYSNEGGSQISQVPVESVWQSSQLEAVKDIVLWQGTLKDLESIKLVLSLVEQDLPPFDPDDILGSAQVVLQNQGDQLYTTWEVPVFDEKLEVEKLADGDPQQYRFKGQGAHYDVAFSVVQQK